MSNAKLQQWLIPVGFAVVCALVLIGFAWWQIRLAAVQNFAKNTETTTPLVQEQPDTNNSEPVLQFGGTVGALRQGDLLAEQGRWSEALKLYTQVAAEEGGLLAIRKVAQAQLQLAQYDDAQQTIALLQKEGAKPADITLLQSIVLLRTGQLTEARTQLSSAEESPQKHYGLMLLAIAEGDHASAQQEAELVQDGSEPVLRNNAGVVQNAYEEYALFPESTDSHRITLLARALAQIQECALAEPLVTQVVGQTPNYRDAWIVKGFCELQLEQFTAAIGSYQTAYNLDPQKVETQYFLGLSYLYSEQYQNAITFFEYALTNGFTPKSELHRLITEAANELGNSELALTHLSSLIELEPTVEHFETYVQTALFLQRNAEAYEKALQMTRQFPESAVAYEQLGLSAEAMGNTSEAIQAYQEALRLDDDRTVSKERLEELQ